MGLPARVLGHAQEARFPLPADLEDPSVLRVVLEAPAQADGTAGAAREAPPCTIVAGRSGGSLRAERP
jgi:hypothetical protein